MIFYIYSSTYLILHAVYHVAFKETKEMIYSVFFVFFIDARFGRNKQYLCRKRVYKFIERYFRRFSIISNKDIKHKINKKKQKYVIQFKSVGKNHVFYTNDDHKQFAIHQTKFIYFLSCVSITK